MNRFASFKKSCFYFLIFFIVMGLPSPIYHQHVDDRHPRPSRHIDNITLYPSGVYSGILQKGVFI